MTISAAKEWPGPSLDIPPRHDRRPLALQQPPMPMTSLVGRERLLDDICARFPGPIRRLLTLTGPGGVGKTRVALALATRLSDQFDGVAFVPLSPLAEPALVLPTIAQTLRLLDSPHRPFLERFAEFLRGYRLLVVLDNFEHLLDAAPVVGELLGVCPGLCLVATSRVRLQLSGEQEYPVAPLALPSVELRPTAEGIGQSTAVALFVERARATDPTFSLTDENAPAIVEICHRLDGLPLAIELAAARVRHLSPSALANRLEYRLPLLIGGPRDVPDRLQTMRDAIAWSYDLLDEDEQTLFRRLSVFVGGCSLTAAEAVNLGGEGLSRSERGTARSRDDDGLELNSSTPRLLDLIASLVDRSLLRHGEDIDGEPRFAMLETIREFGLERLAADGDAESTRQRHALYFVDLAEEADQALHRGSGQGLWSRRLEADHDNLRAALGWSLDGGESELALRLAASLWRFWETRGHLREGQAWLERAIERGGDGVPALRARALNNLGNLALDQSDYPQARARYDESLALRRQLGDRSAIADTLNNLALLACDLGDYERARALHEEGLVFRREVGDQQRLATTLSNLAAAMILAGCHDRARPLLEEALAIRRGIGDTRGIAFTTYYLGEVARGAGDVAGAWRLFEQSLAFFEAIGNKRGAAFPLLGVGRAAIHTGRLGEAGRRLAEVLSIRQDLGDRRGVAETLEVVAALALQLKQLKCAARLLAAADVLRDAVRAPVAPVERSSVEQTTTTVRAALGGSSFSVVWNAGRTLSPEEIAAEVARLVSLVGSPRPEAAQPDVTSTAEPTSIDLRLTARERDILTLLVEGRSDREIAQVLFLSHRTVQSHVSHILAKLGVSSRAVAVAYAHRHGLA